MASLQDADRQALVKIIANLKEQDLQQTVKVLKAAVVGIFSRPVDPVRDGVLNYFSVVSKPMDLGTIQAKLAGNEPYTLKQVDEDVAQIYRNSMLYNGPQSAFSTMAYKLWKTWRDSIPDSSTLMPLPPGPNTIAAGATPVQKRSRMRAGASGGRKKHKTSDAGSRNGGRAPAVGMPLYFDYNATTPISPEVADAMLPFLHDQFGNPSSLHAYGKKCKAAVARSRLQVATLLNCKPEEFIFLSGGSESINYALKGAVFQACQQAPLSSLTTERKLPLHVISSTTEHIAVRETCQYLASLGVRVTYLPVDQHGCVDPTELGKAVCPETVCISIMLANNETGTINDIPALVAAARKKNPKVLFHTDASQAVGKIPVDVAQLGVDLLTVAGHKLYAPKGIGGLYIKEGVKLQQLIHGAHHEAGHRAGTENVLHIVGLGAACAVAHRDASKNFQHMKEMRDLLQSTLFAKLENKLSLPISEIVRVNGHPTRRLPNTLNISIRGVLVAKFIHEIIGAIACSAGAACNDTCEPSHVLQAMKVPAEWACGTLRLTTGTPTTPQQVAQCAEILAAAIAVHSPHMDPPSD